MFSSFSACIQSQYYVRVYNIDDIGTSIVNQQTVVTISYLGDSGYINVNSYLRNGLNNFTFTDYNNGGPYAWGFAIQQNSQIIFSNVAGQAGTYGANNNDGSKTYQYVYSNTIPLNITMCS